MTAELVALNIFLLDDNSKNILLNKTGVPILFYWDGKDDVNQQFLNDKKFRELVDMNCFNKEVYSYSKIGFFRYKLINSLEEYEDKFINIQDIFLLNKLTDNERMFYIEYLLDILNNLYKISMGTEYKADILSDENQKIIQMYLDIQKKYPNRFVKKTLINYVRSELIKTYNLHQNNCDWIIEQLENILVEQN